MSDGDDVRALARPLRDAADLDPLRAVVEEHDTHVGDARFTDMRDAGMVGLGHLAATATARTTSSSAPAATPAA